MRDATTRRRRRRISEARPPPGGSWSTSTCGGDGTGGDGEKTDETVVAESVAAFPARSSAGVDGFGDGFERGGGEARGGRFRARASSLFPSSPRVGFVVVSAFASSSACRISSFSWSASSSFSASVSVMASMASGVASSWRVPRPPPEL